MPIPRRTPKQTERALIRASKQLAKERGASRARRRVELLPEPPDALCAECGHRADEHRPALPSPCRHGWDLAAMARAQEDALEAGACCDGVAAAVQREYEAQRAAGACGCAGFVGGGP